MATSNMVLITHLQQISLSDDAFFSYSHAHSTSSHMMKWLQLDYCYQEAKARFLAGVDRTESAVRMLTSQREERAQLLDLMRSDLVSIDHACASLFYSSPTWQQPSNALEKYTILVSVTRFRVLRLPPKTTI